MRRFGLRRTPTAYQTLTVLSIVIYHLDNKKSGRKSTSIEPDYNSRMDENPYQPPQSPPEPGPTPRAVAGLSLLSLLTVPAAAIAGSATCNGLVGVIDDPVEFVEPIAAGVTVSFFVVAAIMLWLRRRGTSDDRSWAHLAFLLALSQLVATPFAVAAGYIGALAAESVAGSEWLTAAAMSFCAFAVWSGAAFFVWTARARFFE